LSFGLVNIKGYTLKKIARILFIIYDLINHAVSNADCIMASVLVMGE